MELQGIVFDMDGVLYDTERLSMICWERIGKEMGIDKIEEISHGCIALNQTDTRRFIDTNYPGFPYDTFWERLTEDYHEILKEELPLKEGAKEILQYLRTTKLKVGLASSSEKKSVMGHLKRSDMEQYFDFIIGGDMVEHSKPSPDIYEKSCKELGIRVDKAIAVEDSFNGIKSAYAASMMPVMIPDLLQPTEDLKSMLFQKFDSLLELKAYLISEGF